jgi:hypothetical protein
MGFAARFNDLCRRFRFAGAHAAYIFLRNVGEPAPPPAEAEAALKDQRGRQRQ